MDETKTLTVAPTRDPRRVRADDGRTLSIPAGWDLLPPGDAGLTRRVKAAGPSWTVVEMRGNKKFSRGVWAPAAHIEAARAGIGADRSTDAWARRKEADARRRAEEQADYERSFLDEVRAFLRFHANWEPEAALLAALVTAHATPVGSGTVARTERIPVERRAEAAVIAWMRHQTTAYDQMRIARVAGARRDVRRDLAETSRALLDAHRRPDPHPPGRCPLCVALAAAAMNRKPPASDAR